MPMTYLATAVVFAAILLPAALYVWLALKQRDKVASIREFFPLTRFLDGESYGRSTAAAGVSLATVILTLVNLAPVIGISLLITIASYALSFVVLYLCAPTILRANPDNETIQAFLGKAYGTAWVRNVALAFTFVGYISIFSMELLVGVTVLQPFLGEGVLVFAVLYLLFIMVYSMIGGFRAIVATEQWQIRFIIASVLVLLAILPLLWSHFPAISFVEVSRRVLSSGHATWAFCLGIVTMNLPAPISDSGTWQRLCSTRSERDAQRGLMRAIPLFIMIWGTLIVCGCYIAQVASASGQFDASRSSLMTFIVSFLASNAPLHLPLLFVFMLGLFAAMITTADSLLMTATQMFCLDLLHIQASELSERSKIRRVRLALAGIALTSFIVFMFFHFIRFDVVQLIFAIYGAELAVFPPAFVALFLRRWLHVRHLATPAIVAILGGFTGSWATAFYGKATGDLNALYNAPVVALFGSAALLLFGSMPYWRRLVRPRHH